MAPTTTVSDEQIAALRALLQFDPQYQQLTRDLIATGQNTGYGHLVSAACTCAIQRRFSADQGPGEAVQFVARLRITLREQDIDLDPKLAETVIDRALGHPVPGGYEDLMYAEAMVYVLVELVSDENLDAIGLGKLLAQSRKTANAVMAAQAGEPTA